MGSFKGVPLQHYDILPNLLQPEPMAKSSQVAAKCKPGQCPIIGSFMPSNCYSPSYIFRDPQEQRRVFIVIETPFETAQWWNTDAGRFLNSLMHQQRTAGTSIAVGFLTKCTSPRATTDKFFKLELPEVQYCSTHLYEEIYHYDPQMVVLMGSGAAKAFLGDKSLIDLRGTLHSVTYAGGKVIPTIATISPQFVKMNPYQGPVMRVDLAKAFWWAQNHSFYDQWRVRGNPIVFESTDAGIDKLQETFNQLLALGTRETPLPMSWDTEAESLLKSKNRIYSFGFCADPSTAYAINIDHPRSIWTDAQKDRIKAIIVDFLERSKEVVSLISHNSQYDLALIKLTLDYRIRNNNFNTMAMAHSIDEEFRSKEYKEHAFPKYIQTWQGLGAQTEFWLDFQDAGWHNMKKVRGNLGALSTEKVDEYCALDCINTMRVWYVLSQAQYTKSQSAYYANFKIVKPIDYVLSHIEVSGCPVDFEKLKWNSDKNAEGSALNTLMKQEKAIKARPNFKKLNQYLIKQLKKPLLFGGKDLINLNSPDNIQTLFYEILGHEPEEIVDRKTKEVTYKYTTDKGFLENLINEKLPGWEDAAALLEYRQYMKLYGTFITGFLENAQVHHDSRVRASYNSTKTVTFRLSAEDPNLQQIPRSGEDNNPAKGYVKTLIIADKGKALVTADYSTAEVRVGAIASLDKLLAEVFNNSKRLKEEFLRNPTVDTYEKFKFEGDSHRANAAAAYNVPIRQVTKAQRQAAKNVSFLCIYSADPAPQLALKIDSTLEEAKKVVDGFLGKFKGLQAYLSSRDVIATEFGLIHTPLGRTRSMYAAMFPNNRREYSHAINQARNTGIQSSASDLLLLACYKCIIYIEDNKKDWQIVNVVHDSVLAIVPTAEIKEFADVLREAMENPGFEQFGFDPDFCAMVADVEVGKTYKSVLAVSGTPQHWAKVQAWAEAGFEGVEPECPFDNYLGNIGKYEALKDKMGDPSLPMDARTKIEADFFKLEAKLEAIKAEIAIDYA